MTLRNSRRLPFQIEESSIYRCCCWHEKWYYLKNHSFMLTLPYGQRMCENNNVNELLLSWYAIVKLLTFLSGACDVITILLDYARNLLRTNDWLSKRCDPKVLTIWLLKGWGGVVYFVKKILVPKTKWIHTTTVEKKKDHKGSLSRKKLFMRRKKLPCIHTFWENEFLERERVKKIMLVPNQTHPSPIKS